MVATHFGDWGWSNRETIGFGITAYQSSTCQVMDFVKLQPSIGIHSYNVEGKLGGNQTGISQVPSYQFMWLVRKFHIDFVGFPQDLGKCLKILESSSSVKVASDQLSTCHLNVTRLKPDVDRFERNEGF